MRKSELLKVAKTKLYIRNYSPGTIALYMSSLSLFSDWLIHNRIKSISSSTIEQYLKERKAGSSLSTMKLTIAALKFLYKDILEKEIPSELNIRLRNEDKHPVVLSEIEVTAIFDCVKNLKHKTILMTIYSAGLRLGEALNLKIGDIDFDRNVIVIHQGKGKKDRNTVLSEKLVIQIKNYCEKYQPVEYLFEGQKGGKYSASSVQNIMRRAVANHQHQKTCNSAYSTA